MHRLDRELLIKPSEIELMIFDVDGVMTDNHIQVINGELEAKSFCVADGFAFKLAGRGPIKFAIISARRAEPTLVRGTELGIQDIYQQADKQAALEDLLSRYDLNPNQVGHVGNDFPDILLMEQVGLAVCSADAEPEVLPFAHYQTERAGGAGCCREVIQFLFAARGIDFLQYYRDIVADARARS